MFAMLRGPVEPSTATVLCCVLHSCFFVCILDEWLDEWSGFVNTFSHHSRVLDASILKFGFPSILGS